MSYPFNQFKFYFIVINLLAIFSFTFGNAHKELDKEFIRRSDEREFDLQNTELIESINENVFDFTETYSNMSLVFLEHLPVEFFKETEYALWSHDGSQNEKSLSFSISEPELLLVNITNLQNATYLGATNGAITISTITGGAIGDKTINVNDDPDRQYTYAGSPIYISGLVAGNYFLLASDVNGCNSDTLKFTVAEPHTFTFTASVLKEANCFGSSDGQLQINEILNAYSSNYTYSFDYLSWTTLNGDNIISNLQANNYTLWLQDESGHLSEQYSFTITEPDQLIVNTTNLQDATSLGAKDGQITIAEITGGFAGNKELTLDSSKTYTFTGASIILDSLSTGEHFLNATDALGCSSGTLTFTIAELQTLGSLKSQIMKSAVLAMETQSISFVLDNITQSCDDIGKIVISNINGNTGDCEYAIVKSGTEDQAEIEGETYPVIRIGNQSWLGKNLHYDDGSGGVRSYNDDSSIGDEYGYLYNWDAALRMSDEIDGWHLPTQGELDQLGSIISAEKGPFSIVVGDDWMEVGGILKEIGFSHWNSPNPASDDYGFNMLGTGGINSAYAVLKKAAIIWSSTENTSSNAWSRFFYYADNKFRGHSENKTSYVSVRLLKDNDYSSQDWQPLNQVIDTIKIKEQGNYSIVLRDLNGNLSGNTSFEIFYLKKPAIDTTNLQHVSRNNGADGSITVSTNGGAEGNKTIQLTGPVNKTADYSGIPIVFNSLVAGIYQLQATDSNECTSEILTFEITQPACEIDITVTPPPAICEGESINLADYVTLTGVNIENFTIYYYKDASFSELVDNSQMVVDESIYYIKAITPDGCEDQDQIEVIVNPLPELTIVNPPPVCTGESINLTASSITNNADLSGLTMTYWTDAEASSELSNPSSVIAEGNYYIKATNNTTNCSDIFAVNISFIELPVLTFVNPAPVCSGEVIVLTAPSANHYSWSTGDTTQSITVSPTITTTYSLTVIENGCESLADSVEITVNELPSVEIMQNKLACEGETVDLTDPEITNYADTTGLTLSYWKGPEPYVELTDPTAVSNTDIYYIKILNENGCSSFDWISVLFNPIPTAKITTSADTINVGDNVELSSNLADSYVWSNGDTLQSITISPVSTETYSLTVTEKGCESLADSVEIYVNLLPWVNSAYVLPMTICGSGSVTYFATPSSGIINWYDTPYGGIPIMPPSEISETTTLYAEAEDEDGRKSAERTPVTAIVNPLPIVPGIPLVENNCGNSDLIFKGSPESDDICWFWQRYAVNTDTSKFSNPYNVTRAGTYYLRALNTSTNCWSESTSKIVTIREKPEVPEIPVVIDYCGISVLSYSVSPHDAYRFWQTSSTGTDFDQHDNPYNVNNYGIYYLRDYNSYSRCWSEASDSVVANPKEPAIITGDSKVCLGTATQLSGSGIPAAIDPWISSSPTVAIVDSTGLVTGVSEGNCDIHYSTSRGCLTTLTLSVHAIPSTPDIPDVEDRCGYSLLNLNTPAENYTGWYWQTSPTDTEFNYSDTVFAPANYYVRGYNGITQCWGNASEAVTATPKIIPTIIEVFTDSRCGPGIVYLSATSTGLINWYKEEVNGAGLSLQTGLNFSPCISSDTVFYISASLNGCRTPKRVPVAATVREIPNLIITPPPVVCAPPYNCDITAPYITAGSTLDLVFTYWLDADTINSLINPYSALPGMYYIKGIDPHTIIDDEPSTGCYTIKPIIW